MDDEAIILCILIIAILIIIHLYQRSGELNIKQDIAKQLAIAAAAIPVPVPQTGPIITTDAPAGGIAPH